MRLAELFEFKTEEEEFAEEIRRDVAEKLAEEFVGWSHFGITDEDLELLKEMPDDIYKRYSKRLQNAVKDVIKELEEKYGGIEEEW